MGIFYSVPLMMQRMCTMFRDRIQENRIEAKKKKKKRKQRNFRVLNPRNTFDGLKRLKGVASMMISLRYIHYFEQEGLLLAEFVSDFSFFF